MESRSVHFSVVSAIYALLLGLLTVACERTAIDLAPSRDDTLSAYHETPDGPESLTRDQMFSERLSSIPRRLFDVRAILGLSTILLLASQLIRVLPSEKRSPLLQALICAATSATLGFFAGRLMDNQIPGMAGGFVGGFAWGAASAGGRWSWRVAEIGLFFAIVITTFVFCPLSDKHRDSWFWGPKNLPTADMPFDQHP